MMKLPVFALGCVLGLVLAFAPSCGTTARCTTANCAGCCSTDGRCMLGDTANACGRGGIMCNSCQGNQGCSMGNCTTTGTGGGSGGSGGGSTSAGGGSTSAGGGSSSTGGGSSSAGGGSGGGSAAVCNNGNCSDGCCVGTTCIRGTAQNNNQCGLGGFGCLTCVSGNTCTNGQCTGTATCGAGNCGSGCCTGNNCVMQSSQSAGVCGNGGNSCAACPGTQQCVTGSCQTVATCGPGNCAGGCCSNGSCLMPNQQGNGACGVGGGTCGSCNGGQTCTAGSCQTPATLGGPCTSTAQCSSIGAGAFCKLATTAGTPYMNGYCTLPCSTAGAACGGGTGTCIGGSTSVLSVYGEGDMFCAAACAAPGTQSTCRNGYACYGDTTGFCWLDPVPPFDGGGIPNKLGNACVSDTGCINPPGADWGFCLAQSLPDGGSGRFTGGYCTAECTYDNTDQFCGPQGDCFNFTTDPQQPFYLCLRTCPTPGGGRSSIRAGGAYTCRTATAADGGQLGYLWPACDQPNVNAGSCPTNYFCNTTSGYCCDGGNCLR